MISESDLGEAKSGMDSNIRALTAEIRGLRARLAIPQSLRGLASGAGLGFMLGGYTGAAIGAFAGSKLGARSELNSADKEILKNIIRSKEAQLAGLLQQKKIAKAAASGLISAGDLAQMDYDQFAFDGEWFDLFGYPAKPFHCMVFGRPKQGKSIFSFQFANYLQEFGSVLYIASEEGFGGTLQKKIKDFGLDDSELVKFSNAKGIDQMRKAIPGNDFVFIDSVNYARLEVEDVERLKAEFPTVSFITIQQATKGGQFRGSQEYAHNCDMIVEVVAGVAHQQGRFQAASEYQIFKEPEEKAGEGGREELSTKDLL